MIPFVVRGRLIDSTHIELSQPITVANPEVEVVIRPLPSVRQGTLVELLKAMAAFPGPGRSKEDIDRQIKEERDSW